MYNIYCADRVHRVCAFGNGGATHRAFHLGDDGEWNRGAIVSYTNLCGECAAAERKLQKYLAGQHLWVEVEVVPFTALVREAVKAQLSQERASEVYDLEAHFGNTSDSMGWSKTTALRVLDRRIDSALEKESLAFDRAVGLEDAVSAGYDDERRDYTG